jgi:hypothetical protein
MAKNKVRGGNGAKRKVQGGTGAKKKKRNIVYQVYEQYIQDCERCGVQPVSLLEFRKGLVMVR